MRRVSKHIDERVAACCMSMVCSRERGERLNVSWFFDTSTRGKLRTTGHYRPHTRQRIQHVEASPERFGARLAIQFASQVTA